MAFSPEHNHAHKQVTKGVELLLAVVIGVALIGSLTSEKYIDIPNYIIPLLIILFISMKAIHIVRQGGSLLEDYLTLAVMLLFIILYVTLKGNLNPILITSFIIILIYSTGLMFWIKTKISSKRGVHFVFSYVSTVFMVIFLFAGAYLSNPDDFMINGNKRGLTFEEALYFSTITLTTVGYGDILPTSKVNRFFSASEAFIGMTINVALLGYILSAGKN
jgi:hypothetical protein